MLEIDWHWVWGGPPKNLELSSWGQAPSSTGFLCYLSVLGIHLYQYTNWHCRERLHSASVNFFWRLFQWVCPFHDRWFASAPAHTTLSVQQFLTKNDMTHIPQPSYSPDLAPGNVISSPLPPWKKPSKGNVLLMWKRWNKKGQKH